MVTNTNPSLSKDFLLKPMNRGPSFKDKWRKLLPDAHLAIDRTVRRRLLQIEPLTPGARGRKTKRYALVERQDPHPTNRNIILLAALAMILLCQCI